MKGVYIAVARALRSGLRAVGLLTLLDRWARRSRTGLWVRSLLSIYDLADLLAYDVPWWTFRASDEVAAFLGEHPDARVFEWGSGASTAWLARRARTVTSIEHDAAWAELVVPVVPDNVDVRVVPPGAAVGATVAETSQKPGFEGLDFGAYVRAIDDTTGDFDLVIVDGRARNGCYRRAIERLSPGGLLVFDNVDRARYREAIARSSVPVDVTWTRGLTPALPYPTRTALVRLRG